MTGLLWPGDHRAGDAFSDASVVAAAVRVESVWLSALGEIGVAPRFADGIVDEAGAALADDAEIAALAAAGENAGNPIVPLLSRLRDLLADRDPDAARWLHAGLTSQDVLDTALMIVTRDTVRAIRAELDGVITALAGHLDRHRSTPMIGRTLTQPAVEITAGVKIAAWCDGVLDADDDLTALRFPASLSGAAGSRSGTVALGVAAPRDLADTVAAGLGLATTHPWHTTRAPITRAADALQGCTAALGRIATDVITGSRPEIGEFTEPTAAGRGGSSAMPQKVNPVLSVLIRRTALTAPALAALIHTAAADAGDERPPGAWHVEWEPLQSMARHTLAAARQAAELTAGLQIHADAMAGRVARHRDDIDAEHRTLGRLVGRDDIDARGDADAIVDATLTRIRHREDHP
ncbi:MAG: 3-carboxy-cis,cis-muconate cycloisomerase [Williamsia herbipolensis]|nr:3-carboxy-cis,cis-muconate cycloisomerase [Williamsia herbipolensis]